MDPADHLIKHEKISLEEDPILRQPNVSGVKCDIVNECQMFLRAEDGGGDAHMSLSENMLRDKDGKIFSLSYNSD